MAVAAIGFLGLAPSATAQTYGANNQLTIVDATVVVGGTLEASAGVFVANSNVTWIAQSDPVTLATVQANSAGVATLRTALPAALGTGQHTLTASGTGANGQPLSVGSTFAVTARADSRSIASSGGELPRTGSDDNISLAAIGFGLLFTGFIVVIAVRRRSTLRQLG